MRKKNSDRIKIHQHQCTIDTKSFRDTPKPHLGRMYQACVSDLMLNFLLLVIRAIGENIDLISFISSFIHSFTHRENIHLIISMDHPVFDYYCAFIYISKTKTY